MKLIFLGGPGAGKGTQAQKLAAQMNIAHISAGDLLRAEVKAQSALGQKASEFMNAGKLVPDSLIIDIMDKKLVEDACAGGFILDGFPRTLIQAQKLKEIIEIDNVVYIEVGETAIISRSAGRRACRNCNAIFHLIYKPPKDPAVCDDCGGELFQRPDDTPETIKNRLGVYHEQTEPLIEFYENEGILKRVDGEGDIEDIFKSINDTLGL